jgi:hypothetical protein
MKEQLSFSELLKSNGLGIALRKPTQDINVGDVCYWDAKGTATKILNVFENKAVFFPLISSGDVLTRSG